MRNRKNERGSAMILVVVITIMIVGLAAAYLALTAANEKMTAKETMGLQALYNAEAAMAVTLSNLNSGQLAWSTLAPANVGVIDKTNAAAMMQGNFGNGSWEATVCCWGYDNYDNNLDGFKDAADANETNFMTITARGTVGTEVRQVRADISRTGGGVWWNALFMGNSSGTTGVGITLQGSGTGSSSTKDIVNGDVYVNGNINATGQSQLNGNVMMGPVGTTTTDASTGWNGQYTTGYQAPPSINAADYANNNDVNVASSFSSSATYGPAVPNQNGSTPAGGSAYQITDENDPAHVFRKNPDNGRIPAGYSGSNGKDNYFFEDPNQGIHSDPNWNGSDATKIKILPNGNNKVYFIDGNLWIHNLTGFSYKLYGPGMETSGIRLTIVVRGNITIADNMFYQNMNKDGLALIAIKDPSNGNSGNILYGDPLFGTVENNEMFMYAENNFTSTNVSAGGSAFNLLGNMTAGNLINFNSLGTGSNHHPININFDDRLKTGQLQMNGLPPQPGSTAGDWVVMTWMKLSPTEPAITHGPGVP